MADVLIAIAIGILTLATAYMGVHVTLHPPEEKGKSKWKAAFSVAAILICALIGWQTERSVNSQELLQAKIDKMKPPTAEENAAAIVKLEREQKQTNVAIEAPRKAPNKREESPKVDATQSEPNPVNPPQVASFNITQTADVSDRPDTPYKTHIVVQGTAEFPSLRIAIQCDGPIAEGAGGPDGTMFMDTYGVVNGHPGIFVLTYKSANPPFSPSSPLNFIFWSKGPIKCTKASTF
jgi:hypothetical protein